MEISTEILGFTGNLRNLQDFLLAFSKHRKYFKVFHINLELPLFNILIPHIGILCSKIQFPHYNDGTCYQSLSPNQLHFRRRRRSSYSIKAITYLLVNVL